jgi:hypothetical protein
VISPPPAWRCTVAVEWCCGHLRTADSPGPTWCGWLTQRWALLRPARRHRGRSLNLTKVSAPAPLSSLLEPEWQGSRAHLDCISEEFNCLAFWLAVPWDKKQMRPVIHDFMHATLGWSCIQDNHLCLYPTKTIASYALIWDSWYQSFVFTTTSKMGKMD